MSNVWSSAIRMLAVLTFLTGLAYPVAVTLAARVVAPHAAGGSLLRKGDVVVGSDLLAQAFHDPRYFRARPSASEWGAVPSGAGNQGPASATLRAQADERAAALRAEHGLASDAVVPPELLAASGSGLDPHLSPQAVEFQAGRVAEARGLPRDFVMGLVREHTEPPAGGWLGSARVNVLQLNMALDRVQPSP
jgi:K+-transporting ATPase ATPase C chain